ncbi:hypothetical protein H4R35_003356 [Dimargaris xerosporica]|nr:hypothetical protein H4R35_003356 [Dimargaris xerosporica]
MPKPRQRQRPADQERFQELDDIPEAEKRRLIEETGILKKIPKPAGKPANSAQAKDGDDDEAYELAEEMPFLVSLLYTFPATFVYGTFEVLVQQQYGMDWTAREVLGKCAKAFPMLLTFIYFTYKFRSQTWMKVFQWLTSTAAGAYFMYLNLYAPAVGIMRQCPGLITLWVYGIFMLDNLPMLANLLVVAVYWRLEIWRMTTDHK